MDEVDPRPLLVSSRERRLDGGEPPHLDPALQRVRRGYYRPAEADLTDSQRYRLRIYAAREARTEELVFSHASAGELWGCPLLRADTALVHTTRPGKARRTTAATITHRADIPDGHVVELESGLLVTSREWTAVQLAAALPLPNVLLPLDRLVRLLNEDAQADPGGTAVIERLLALIPPGMKHGQQAERHLRLADPRSGSAGESLSRGQMVRLGVPMPRLQVHFPRGDQPGDDIVDFDWPEEETFGEFDGEGKYFQAELTGGRTPAQVLWEEKRREDRIRRHRPRAARWGWNEAMSLERLGWVLAQAGIRPQRRS